MCTQCGKSIKPYLSLADIEVHLRQACQPLQLPLGIRIHHSHDITRQPSGGQSCKLCGAVVRRNTKRLQVPCRKLAVANRHGQVLGGKKNYNPILDGALGTHAVSISICLEGGGVKC